MAEIEGNGFENPLPFERCPASSHKFQMIVVNDLVDSTLDPSFGIEAPEGSHSTVWENIGVNGKNWIDFQVRLF